MDIYKLIHLILKNLKLLLAVPVIGGALMFLLTLKQTLKYSSKASVFTAITANTSLEDLGQNRVDYFATKAAYNNLLSIISSRDVIEETSLRLLAQHLVLDKPVYNKISKDSYKKLQSIIPSEIRKLIDVNDEEKAYQSLKKYIKQDKNNFLYGLLNYDHPHYSYKAISQIKTIQIGGSDIIELSYQTNDPGITYQTLNILIEIFINKYSILKKNQTNAVVGYFENQLEKKSNDLSDAEDRLLNFNKTNNIINYYEQTKHISSQQEKIEIKLQEELMKTQAASAVLKKLEEETQERFKINLKNSKILKLRGLLIKANRQLANLEIEIKGDDKPVTSKKIKALKKKIGNLEKEMKTEIILLNNYERNSEGIAVETILNDWLKTVIEYESANARLIAMKNKSEEFNKMYSEYAPLGADLKRIEREISVNESAYLEILHYLGMAKLKQQNEEMMSNMKILDKPVLPIAPEPTKRKLFVIVIVFFGFIFTLTGIIVFELLDKRIKTIKRFNELTGFTVSGVYVLEKKYKGINIQILKSKGLKPVVETITKKRNELKTEKPYIVQFMSIWQNEGKTHIINSVNSQLAKLGYKTLVLDLNPADDLENTVGQEQIFKEKSYLKFISQHEDIDILLVEIPALSTKIFNSVLLKDASFSYLIGDAGRTWSAADDFTLEKLKADMANYIQGILNKAQPDSMSDIIGEIPKKRSFIRRYIKYKIANRFFK